MENTKLAIEVRTLDEWDADALCAAFAEVSGKYQLVQAYEGGRGCAYIHLFKPLSEPKPIEVGDLVWDKNGFAVEVEKIDGDMLLCREFLYSMCGLSTEWLSTSEISRVTEWEMFWYFD